MTFTTEEENILKLIIDELKTRKKADAQRKILDTEMRATINPLIAQVNASYQASMALLMKAHYDAEVAIEEVFTNGTH